MKCLCVLFCRIHFPNFFSLAFVCQGAVEVVKPMTQFTAPKLFRGVQVFSNAVGQFLSYVVLDCDVQYSPEYVKRLPLQLIARRPSPPREQMYGIHTPAWSITAWVRLSDFVDG